MSIPELSFVVLSNRQAGQAAGSKRSNELNRSPVIALNHAVAVAMSAGFEEGLRRIDALLDLDRYYLFHAARADILRRMNRLPEAKAVYEQALSLATNRIEQEFLSRRLSQVSQCGAGWKPAADC